MTKTKIVILTLMMACTMMACGKTNVPLDTASTAPAEAVKENENAAVELSTVVDAIKEAYGEDYLPSMKMEGEALESTYGLTADLYQEVYVEVPMISVNIDTLIAVKTAEGKQQAVVDALNKYRDYLLNDALQYPMNQLKLQSSRIIEKDGFVFFVSLGVIPMELEGEEQIIEKAAELNDIAQEAIDGLLK